MGHPKSRKQLTKILATPWSHHGEMNFCGGFIITSVTFRAYAIGGFGMIPGTIVYVFVGTTIGNISAAASGDFEGGTATLVMLIVGTVLAFIAIIYVTVVVKRYLNK